MCVTVCVCVEESFSDVGCSGVGCWPACRPMPQRMLLVALSDVIASDARRWVAGASGHSCARSAAATSFKGRPSTS